jgi:predicted RNase H-like HicB family nuclease
MKFTIAIEAGTRKNAFGIAVPDLPGCFSAGDSVEESLR